MRVAILGAGGIALGMAAALEKGGHKTAIWSPAVAKAPPKDLRAEGVISGTFHPTFATSVAQAIEGADVVAIAMPGNGHRATFDAMAPHLRAGQLVIISSHSSLGALYLSKLLAGRKVECVIAAWPSTIVTGRRQSPGVVNIGTLRNQIDLATVPASAGEQALKTCQALFGDRFKLREDLIAVSLSNLNPPAHMANSLCNLTRMEKGETWSNYGCMTDAVGRLIEALDDERLAIAAAFGLKVRSAQDHFHLSFDLKRGTIGEMARELETRRQGKPPGPTTLEHRYITEDVPFGLLPLVKIAHIAGVKAPLHEAGVALFSVLYGRDLAGDNDILPSLGIDKMSRDELQALARNGFASRAVPANA